MSSLNGEARAQLKDGRELKLAFDFDAMVVIEDMLDVPAIDLLQELSPKLAVPGDPTSPVVKEGRTPRLKEMRALIAGALHRHHPEIGIDEVGALVLSDGDRLAAALGRAVEAGFGGGDSKGGAAADVESGPPKPSRGAGKKR